MRIWITEIILENFQGHKRSVLKLHEGVNMIIGETHKGKSSIIRAIQTIFENNPRNPDDIIMDDEEYSRATIKLSDGHTIIKDRKVKLNKYTVVYPNGQQEVLKGFGTDVPKEISRILQAPFFKVDNTSDGTFMLNISSQLSPHFLLTNTGSIRAKVLTKITGGNIFDEAIKINNRTISQHNQKKTYIEEEIEKLKEEVNLLQFVDDSLEKVNSLIEIVKRYQVVKKEKEQLESLINKLKFTIENITEKTCLHELLNDKDGIQPIYTKTIDVQASKQQLSNKDHTLMVYRKNNTSIRSYDSFVLKTQNVDEILSTFQSFKDVYREHNHLTKLRNTYRLNEQQLEQDKALFESLKSISSLSNKTQDVVHSYQVHQTKDKILTNYQTLNSRIVKANEYVDKLEVAVSIQQDIKKYADSYKELQSINRLRNSVQTIEKSITEREETVIQLKPIAKLKTSVDTLNQHSNQLTEVQKSYVTLSNHQQKISDYQVSIEQVNGEMVEWEEKLSQFDTCPLCQQPLNEEHKHQMKEGYTNE